MILVIIPVYNAEKYLQECLDCLFRQTCKDFCVGCVDDGSTDNSLDILKSYASKQSNMRVVHTSNFGPSHARNLALHSFVNGEIDWIMFLDADDALEPDYLQQMIDAQTSSKADIVCSSFQFYKNGEKRRFGLMGGDARLLSGFDATKELLADKTIQSHSPCKLYRSSLWMDVHYPEHIVAMEDQGTIFKIFFKAKRVFVNPGIDGYLYRRTEGSVCSSPITAKRVLDSIEGYSISCRFDYPGIDAEKKNELTCIAKQSLAACYLMMYPRYNKKTASEKEKERWVSLRNYLKAEKVVSFYRPDGSKEKMKRWCYLYLRPFYRVLYSAFSG